MRRLRAAFGLSFVRDELHELRRETREGFAAVNGRLDAVTGRVDGLQSRMDAGFAEITARFDSIEAALQQLLERG